MRTPTDTELAEVSAEFEKAKQEAAKTGGMVCGTVRPDGRPVYWVAPKTLDDQAGEDRAFELKYGRRPEVERKLMSIAQGVDLDRWRGAGL